MKEREYFRTRERIKSDYEHKLRALDTTWTVMTGLPPPKMPPASKRKSADDDGETLATALVAIISSDMMANEFNTLDIDGMLRKVKPDFAGSRSTVTHTLKRLTTRVPPPIEIVQPGKGKRPTTYRKLEAAHEPAGVNLDDL